MSDAVPSLSTIAARISSRTLTSIPPRGWRSRIGLWRPGTMSLADRLTFSSSVRLLRST